MYDNIIGIDKILAFKVYKVQKEVLNAFGFLVCIVK